MEVPVSVEIGTTERRQRDDMSASARRQQQMWNILRSKQGRNGLIASDLAMLASTDISPISQEQAVRYLEALVIGRYAKREPYHDTRVRVTSEYRHWPRAPLMMVVRLMLHPDNRRLLQQYVAVEEEL